ncbi:MAG: hypothetical protein M0D55_02995 [Elusimicrobiota bacterium]|nr:MAG: hypothetical protein M0D55_02995 [Elusimicrobiota bacterium]
MRWAGAEPAARARGAAALALGAHRENLGDDGERDFFGGLGADVEARGRGERAGAGLHALLAQFAEQLGGAADGADEADIAGGTRNGAFERAQIGRVGLERHDDIRLRIGTARRPGGFPAALDELPTRAVPTLAVQAAGAMIGDRDDEAEAVEQLGDAPAVVRGPEDQRLAHRDQRKAHEAAHAAALSLFLELGLAFLVAGLHPGLVGREVAAAAGVVAGQRELHDHAFASQERLADLAQAVAQLAGDGLEPDLGAARQAAGAEQDVVLGEVRLDETGRSGLDGRGDAFAQALGSGGNGDQALAPFGGVVGDHARGPRALAQDAVERDQGGQDPAHVQRVGRGQILEGAQGGQDFMGARGAHSLDGAPSRDSIIFRRS